MYLWERKEWPRFTWDRGALADLLAQVAREQGRLLGRMQAMGFEHRGEAHLHALTEEVVKSSEIEGESLPRDQVRSSIARSLGMDIAGLVPADRNVEGIVEMMLDATSNK
jgi:Fic family protein